MNKRMIGSAYEDAAITFLYKNGFQILERNYSCKIGEIDIIAKKDGILRFIEVKYRKDECFGNAAYAVNQKKLRKIYHVAEFYLLKNKLASNTTISFDVLTITGNQINYITNCSGAM